MLPVIFWAPNPVLPNDTALVSGAHLDAVPPSFMLECVGNEPSVALFAVRRTTLRGTAWFKNFEGQCAAVTVNGSAADGVVEHVDFACPPAGRVIGNRAPGVHVANGDAKRVTVR